MLSLDPITRDNLPDARGVRVDSGPRDPPVRSAADIMLEKCLARSRGQVWHPFLIRKAGAPVGIVAVSIDRVDRLGGAQSAWVHNFIIDGEEQGQGIGRGALAAIFDWLRREHPAVRRVGLNVRQGNAAALALYSSVGFGPVGRTRDGREIMLIEFPRPDRKSRE